MEQPRFKIVRLNSILFSVSSMEFCFSDSINITLSWMRLVCKNCIDAPAKIMKTIMAKNFLSIITIFENSLAVIFRQFNWNYSKIAFVFFNCNSFDSSDIQENTPRRFLSPDNKVMSMKLMSFHNNRLINWKVLFSWINRCTYDQGPRYVFFDYNGAFVG